jgi:hypothetical protein
MADISMTYAPGSDGPHVYRCCNLVIFHAPQATYHLWRAHEFPFLAASAAVDALRSGGNGLEQEVVPAPSNLIEAAEGQPHQGITVLEAFLVQCQYAHKHCTELDARRLMDTLYVPYDAPAPLWQSSINEMVQRLIDREAP